MIHRNLFLVWLLLKVPIHCLFAQDSIDRSHLIADNYFTTINLKANSLKQKIDKKSEKTLQQLQRKEEKIYSQLAKKDPLLAKELINNSDEQYQSLRDRISKISSLKKYIPALDTLNTSLQFMQNTPGLLSKTNDARQKVNEALGKVKSLKQSIQKAEDIKQFLKERKQFLQQQLREAGFAKQLKKLNKQVYYYSEQLNEYKAVLSDHKKAERRAMEILVKTKVYNDFLRRNSELASLFRLPRDDSDPGTIANLAGLQTRSQVNTLIQEQIGTSDPNALGQVQQSLLNARDELKKLRNRVSQFGGNSSADEIPDGFKPNNQRTKSFWNRLEYGTNFQSQRSNGYLPVTTDIGLSLGYKLNDKSIIGLGVGYKLGWGQNIRHINISNQGLALRSFLDWRLKGSFWLSGGFEMNYRSELKKVFNSYPTQGHQEQNLWQQSGLVGMSKILSINSRIIKKTKVQLLWDFLSYRQLPRTRPIIFRLGYNFK